MNNNFKYIKRSIFGLCFLLSTANVSAQLSATELARIFAGDAAQGDSYGYAVDIDGDRAVIGAALSMKEMIKGSYLSTIRGPPMYIQEIHKLDCGKWRKSWSMQVLKQATNSEVVSPLMAM